MEKFVPESRASVEPVHVVAAPPTRFVKVPPTESVFPVARVKELAASNEVFDVVVAFPVTDQPPAALFTTTA
jgi:hypothetical protein